MLKVICDVSLRLEASGHRQIFSESSWRHHVLVASVRPAVVVEVDNVSDEPSCLIKTSRPFHPI